MTNLCIKLIKFLKIEEIENSVSLKTIQFLISASLIILIERVISVLYYKTFTSTCFPFFQNCKDLQSLVFINGSNSLRFIFFTYIFAFGVYSLYAIYRGKYRESYFSLLLMYFTFILPWFIVAGYHDVLFKYPEQYFFYVITFFLFTPGYRFFYLQLFFILSYFLSSISKFESLTWINGNMDLFLVPTGLAPFMTNLLLVLQLTMPILLLSKNKRLRLLTIVVLEAFHLYTVGMVNITFFLITSPFIYILFYEHYTEIDLRKVYKSVIGFLIILLMLFFNLTRLFIPLSDYYTYEGAYLGFNMYQSYKGCEIEYIDTNGGLKKISIKKGTGNQACDPYHILMSIKNNCENSTENKSFKIITEYKNETVEIVNEKNYCNLEYKVLSRNEWINPKIVWAKTSDSRLIHNFFLHIGPYLQKIYFFLFSIIFFYLIFKTFGIDIFKIKD